MNLFKRDTDLIIDCFAGGGGASTGIEMALGRPVDIAINHDPAAIKMHKTNHPKTLHLTEDIFEVDLEKYVAGRHVSLMWASPDCTSHSKAKGGQPRQNGLRILPWAVYQHAKKICPDVIIMENVEEIQQWGPLDANGKPIKERMGEDYQKFISAMQSLGYVFDSRELVAADYGAPTTRKRWYAIFRRDGRDIIWPESTHSKNGDDGKEPWVPVSSVLDFSNLGKSIFGRKKPLAENTMRRIARGLDKFVFRDPDPFILKIVCDGNSKGEKRCLRGSLPSTVTVPFIDKSYGGNYQGSGSGMKQPLHTITTVDHNRLIQPLLIQYHAETNPNGFRGQSVMEPLQTIDTSNRYGLVLSFLTKFYKSGIGQTVKEPIHTITTSPGHFGQVSIVAVDRVQLQMSGVDEEIVKKATWLSQFIMEYYGASIGQSLNDPLHTIVTKERFALITVLGNQYAMLDVYLRMLTPEELKIAQGFPEDYIIDRDGSWKKTSISDQVKRIGNSVVPIMAQALVEANCSYLKVGDRVPSPRVFTELTGQIAFA